MNISVGRIVSAYYVYILRYINGTEEKYKNSYNKINVKVM